MKSSNSHQKIYRRLIAGLGFLALGVVGFALVFPMLAKSNATTKPPTSGQTAKSSRLSPHTAQTFRVMQEAQTLTDQGDSLLTSGKVAEAEERYKKALVIHPGNSNSWLGLARIAEKRGNKGEAKRAYKTFLMPPAGTGSDKAIDPTAMIRYSELCRESGDLAEERWINRRIIERSYQGQEFARYYANPEPLESNDGDLRARAEVVAGAAIGKDSKEKYEESLRHYQAAIAANPNDPVAYYFLGRRLEGAHKDMEALQAYKTARAMESLSGELKKRLDDNIESIERNHRRVVYTEEDMKKGAVVRSGPLPGPHKFPGVVKPGYVAEFKNGKWEIIKKN